MKTDRKIPGLLLQPCAAALLLGLALLGLALAVSTWGLTRTLGQPFAHGWLGHNGARYAHIARNYARDGLLYERANIRQAIRDDGAAWRKATTGAAFKKRFGEVRGDRLTRPPRGFDGEDANIDDIRRKSFFAMEEASEKLAKSAALPDAVAAAMSEAAPLMKFLCKATAAPF